MTNTLGRTMRISRRPLFTFAFALSPLVALAAVSLARHGPQPAILFLALVPLVLYAIIVTIVVSQRVTIRDRAIEMTTLFRFHRRIPFSIITRTEIQTRGNPPRPVRALIHTTDPEDPVVTISLKAIAPEDAAWLVALSELKTAASSKA